MPRPPEPRDPERCAEVRGLLEAYVDGELAPDDGQRLRRHAAGCPDCAGELARAAEVKTGLTLLPRLRCPPRVSRAVLRQAAAEVAAARRRRFAARLRALAAPAWRPALAAALLAAVLAGALYFAPGPGPGRPAGVEMSPRELARTEAEVKLAFAYLSRIGLEAGDTMRREMVDNVILPTRRALYGLEPVEGAPRAGGKGGNHGT